MQQQIQYVKSLDGTRIAYAVLGDGPPLVRVARFGHGIEPMWHDEDAAAFYSRLSEGRQLIAVERRGQGSSQRDVEDLTMRAHVGDVRAVVDHLSLDRFAMFGDGDSAAVCIEFAANHPEQVSQLVLWGGYAEGSKAFGEYQPDQAQSPQVALALSTHPQAPAALSKLIAGAMVPSGPLDLQRRLTLLMQDLISREMNLRYLAFAQQIDVADQLPQITCPTLAVHRRGDKTAHTLELSREIASLIPDARLVVVEGDIAFPEYDHEETIQAIDDFLGDVDPSGQPPIAELPSGTAVILFLDIADSTALTTKLGDAAYRDKERALDASLRTVITESGGTPVEGKVLGDGIMSVFTSARQAIDAAQRCRDLGNGAGLPLCLGIHAGDVVREGNNLHGGAIQVASRVVDLAEPGEILVSATVRDLARTSAGVSFDDCGEHELKGIDEPQRLFAVRGGS